MVPFYKKHLLNDPSFQSLSLFLEIQLGSTAIGIRTSEGVVLAVEKRVTSPLMESKSVEKIVEIDTHLGCAMSGLIADSRTLVDKARVEAQVSLLIQDLNPAK